MMRLQFGPLRLRLHGPENWLDLARRRYGAFVDCAPSAPGEAEFRVDYRAEGQGPTPRQLGESLLRPLELTERAGVWHLRAPGISGRLSADRMEVRGPLATFPLDSALLALLCLTAGPDIVVVHGALLAEEDRGRGWLCTGPSGVGKSTLARLLPDRALCDELTVIRREHGVLVAYSLPFWQGRPARVRLAGVHFLRHAARPARRPLSAAQAFAALRSQILWPLWHGARLEAAFGLAATLAELPCHILDFRPDPGIWHHLCRLERAS